MLKSLLKRFFAEPIEEDAKATKARQIMRLGLMVGVGFTFIFVIISWRTQTTPAEQKQKTPAKPITLAADSVDVRDVWAHRLMEQGDAHTEEMETLRLENKMLQERMDTLEELKLSSLKTGPDGLSADGGVASNISGNEESLSSLSGIPTGGEQEHNNGPPTQAFKSAKPRMSFIRVDGDSPQQFHADSYVTAGTYSHAALMSGLVVSTAVASQSNPQPVAIRLLDSGNLPRGWKSKVKDAVLIGSCYGDLSAERAMCRINSLSFTESDGTGVEIAVEGWIFGEDGSPGIRGKVVDRAGEVARESLLAGILGGMSSFLKSQATSSVFPVTPFGQTNALSGEDMLKGSAGAGASNALEKLAEFSIKRAESMQPVIVVNGGRRVDILFKKGFSLKPNVGNTIKVKEHHD